MNKNLAEINKQLEALSVLIGDYLNSSKEDRIIIYKDNFNNLNYLPRIVGYNLAIFNYDNRCLFFFAEQNNYHKELYDKLLDGALDRLIIKKREVVLELKGSHFNYEIEPLERTKLYDLYGK
jgi:hypothetical protein